MNDTSIITVISQLCEYCLPYLTTLLIVTDSTHIPQSRAFSPLFYYNCFPSLKHINILTLTEYPLRKDSLSGVDNKKIVDDTIQQEKSEEQSVADEAIEQKASSEASSQVNSESLNNGVLRTNDGISTKNKDCAVKTMLSQHEKFKPKGTFYSGDLEYTYEAKTADVDYENDSYHALVVTIHDWNESRFSNREPYSQRIRYKGRYYYANFSCINRQHKCSDVVIDVSFVVVFKHRSYDKSEYWNTISTCGITICL